MRSCKQDWFAVASILEHTLSTVKLQMPNITEVFLRSDNAGCYHTANLWLSIPGISQRTGVNIRQLSYSEASSGKSYCDAKFAHMRGKMRTFVAGGRKITCAQDMKEAIGSGKGVTGCQVSVIDIDTSKQSLSSHLWKNVSSVSNLQFTSEGVVVYKAYGIGSGMYLDNAALDRFSKHIVQGDCLPSIIQDFVAPDKGEGSIKVSSVTCSENEETEHNEDRSGDVDTYDVEDSLDQPGVFHCPEPGCLKVYQKCSSLDDHLLIGRHVFVKTTSSSFDQVKRQWAETCNSVKECSRIGLQSHEHIQENQSSKLSMGWALKKERKCKRFSIRVKEYLKEVFEEGERSGKKSNPPEVAKSIKTARGSDGKRIFQPSEWLQPSQVASYFCRLSLLSRSQTNIKMNKPSTSIETIEDEDLMSILASMEEAEMRQNINT